MLFDASLLFADGDDHGGGGNSDSIDMANAYRGPGQSVQVHISIPDCAGTAGIIGVEDSADDSTFADVADFDCTVAKAAAGLTIMLPNTVRRYVRLVIPSQFTTATVTAGIVVDGQSNT